MPSGQQTRRCLPAPGALCALCRSVGLLRFGGTGSYFPHALSPIVVGTGASTRNLVEPFCDMKVGKGIAWPRGSRWRTDWREESDGKGGGLLDAGQRRGSWCGLGVEQPGITPAAILGG